MVPVKRGRSTIEQVEHGAVGDVETRRRTAGEGATDGWSVSVPVATSNVPLLLRPAGGDDGVAGAGGLGDRARVDDRAAVNPVQNPADVPSSWNV